MLSEFYTIDQDVMDMWTEYIRYLGQVSWQLLAKGIDHEIIANERMGILDLN